jgi:hypothetical protein
VNISLEIGLFLGKFGDAHKRPILKHRGYRKILEGFDSTAITKVLHMRKPAD